MANIINKEIGKCIINTYDSNTPNNQFQVVLLVLTVTFYWCLFVRDPANQMTMDEWRSHSKAHIESETLSQ